MRGSMKVGFCILGLLVTSSTLAQFPMSNVAEQPAKQAPTCLGFYKGEFVLDLPSFDWKPTPNFGHYSAPTAISAYCSADALFQRVRWMSHLPRPAWGPLFCPPQNFVPVTVGDYVCNHQTQSTETNKELRNALDAATRRIAELEKRLSTLEHTGQPALSK